MSQEFGCRVPGSTGCAGRDRRLPDAPSHLGFSDEENSFKPYQLLTLLYKPRSYTKAYTVFTGTEAHTAHVVCGQQTNNSLNQKHFRKQEGLSVRKPLFIVPISHLSVHSHKQTDARDRKQAHSMHPLQEARCRYSPAPQHSPGTVQARTSENATVRSKHASQMHLFRFISAASRYHR